MAQWFGPKVVGYGIGPRSWQGWLATALVSGATIGSRFVAPETLGLPHWTRPVFLGIVVLGYIALVYFTYEDD